MITFLDRGHDLLTGGLFEVFLNLFFFLLLLDLVQDLEFGVHEDVLIELKVLLGFLYWLVDELVRVLDTVLFGVDVF